MVLGVLLGVGAGLGAGLVGGQRNHPHPQEAAPMAEAELAKAAGSKAVTRCAMILASAEKI